MPPPNVHTEIRNSIGAATLATVRKWSRHHLIPTHKRDRGVVAERHRGTFFTKRRWVRRLKSHRATERPPAFGRRFMIGKLAAVTGAAWRCPLGFYSTVICLRLESDVPRETLSEQLSSPKKWLFVSEPSKSDTRRGLPDLGNPRFFLSDTMRADAVRCPRPPWQSEPTSLTRFRVRSLN